MAFDSIIFHSYAMMEHILVAEVDVMTRLPAAIHLQDGLMLAVALTTFIDMASNVQGTSGVGSATLWHWVSLGIMLGACMRAPRSGWLIGSTIGVAALSGAWQFLGAFVSPSAYLLSPPNVLWVIVISWWIWRNTPDISDSVRPSFTLLLLTLPFVLVATLFVGYSPLTAVYADTYGGGDTLVGQGVSGLLFFAVCWGSVHVWLRQQHSSTWSFAFLSGCVAVGQALLRGEWYLCAAFFISTVLADLIVSRWPSTHRMVVAGWPALFCLGYFFTLRYTSLLAWNLTVWGGVVVFALGIGYALITLAATTHVLPKKGTTA